MLYLHGYEGTKYPNSVRMHLEARKNIPILQQSIRVFWRVRDTTACRRRGAVYFLTSLTRRMEKAFPRYVQSSYLGFSISAMYTLQAFLTFLLSGVEDQYQPTW